MTFIIISLIKILVVFAVLMTALAYVVWLERKVSAHIQARWGPYLVGPFGLLQPLADLLKFIFKEDTAPSQIDRRIYYVAPALALFFSLLSISVVPFGGMIEVAGYRTWLQITDINIGLLFVFAVTSLGVYGIALAGWSSGSKYSLLGGLRSSAQMVSYELGLGFAVIPIVMMAGTLSLRGIVDHQAGYWGIIPQWHVVQFLPTGLVAFFVYLIAGFAETNRLPFDMPEAEGELVAGFHTEYSSLKFAMFFVAEYANMVTVSCLATVLFLGGWLSPLPGNAGRFLAVLILLAVGGWILWQALSSARLIEKAIVPLLGLALVAVALVFAVSRVIYDMGGGVFWFCAKIFFFLFFFIWVRWSLPRYRYDQVMALGWKVLLPLAAVNIILTGLLVALLG